MALPVRAENPRRRQARERLAETQRLGYGMPTVLREAGFVFRMYPADHEPPHVHVFYGGAELKASLGDDASPPTLLMNWGMSRAQARQVLRIIEANRALLHAAWKEIHGEK